MTTRGLQFRPGTTGFVGALLLTTASLTTASLAALAVALVGQTWRLWRPVRGARPTADVSP